MLASLVHELWRRDRVLTAVGWFHVALLLLAVAAAPFDAREVTGLNPWIKPMKFAASVAIYVWTIAWLLGDLDGPRWVVRVVRWGIALVMVPEVLMVFLQAGRGVPSHFNVATAFDGGVFSLMGLLIGVNSTLAVLLAVTFFVRRPPGLSDSYLWGIRLGFVLFLLGSIEGGVMIERMAHTVGAPDGGPGLPFVGWSTAAGDLRPAHLVGLHALQVVPLVGWGIGRIGAQWPRGRRLAALLGFVLVYGGLGVLLFRQALAGRPLVAL